MTDKLLPSYVKEIRKIKDKADAERMSASILKTQKLYEQDAGEIMKIILAFSTNPTDEIASSLHNVILTGLVRAHGNGVCEFGERARRIFGHELNPNQTPDGAA